MTKYNMFAGESLERLSALSDGVFSIAMTLLVLDLRIPDVRSIHSERALIGALAALVPRLIPYVMTFLTLGIFWVGQQTQLGRLSRSDRNLSWIQIAFLLAVTLTPFSAALLSAFIRYRSALIVYWFNILLLGLVLLASWTYAVRAGLVKADVSPQVSRAMVRRIVIAQILYAFGAALCAIDTYVSIAFMILVQLNYAIAPRVWLLYRL